MPRPSFQHAELPRLVTTQAPREAAPQTPVRADSLFETGVSAISRLVFAASLEGRLTLLRDAQPRHLQRAVVEAKAINETSFLRDAEPFETLRQHVLPCLINKRRQQRRLRLWSAACSNGQEAYSLALMLVHHFPELADWDVQILGTDVSDRAIACAAQAQYRRCEVERGLPQHLLEQYFKPRGEVFQVCAEVRKLCEFRVLDLSQPMPALPLFDLILLRNVLLYLPPGERGQVFEVMHRHLWQRGFLMLGHAEQAEDFTSLFKPEAGLDSHFYRPEPTG